MCDGMFALYDELPNAFKYTSGPYLVLLILVCGLVGDAMIPLAESLSRHQANLDFSQTWEVLGPFRIGTRGKL